MNLPIDVVVELLMANCTFNKGQCDHPYWIRMDCNGWRIVEADSQRELRSKVHEYLLTLVPKPVLLSECEERRPYVVADSAGWLDVVCRSGNEVTGYNIGRQAVALWGNASDFQVIQPVEVK